MYLLGLQFCSDICPGTELLHHMVMLVYLRSLQMFSLVAPSFYLRIHPLEYVECAKKEMVIQC